MLLLTTLSLIILLVFIPLYFFIFRFFLVPLRHVRRKSVICDEGLNTSAVRKIRDCLSTYCPEIPINSQDLVILDSPVSFRSTLIQSIRQAEHQIVIAALYMGTSKIEQTIMKELELAAQAKPDLKITLMFDHRRSLRGFGSRSDRKCVVELLSGLLEYNNVSLHLFHVPIVPFVPLISREAEVLGVFHQKYYLFDSNVIVTGANLSEDYLSGPESGKQDRYFVFNKSNVLCDWYLSLTEKYLPFCFKVENFGTGLPVIIPPFVNPITNPWKFRKNLKKTLFNLITSFSVDSSDQFDTAVYPTLQAGFSGVGHESFIVERTLKTISQSSEPSHLTVTTPYLNFPNSLIRRISNVARNSCVSLTLIAASPKANSFYGAKGILGKAPLAYVEIMRGLLRRVVGKVEVYLYNRPNWRYHGKAIYYESSGNLLTIIGSSNYSKRSKRRDTECSLFLNTSNPVLIEQIKKEKADLMNHCEAFFDDFEKCPMWIRFLMVVFGSIL
ncbi:hypothetical protein RCL1_004360 [Eukaryota sp. TZLM3-RCL]